MALKLGSEKPKGQEIAALTQKLRNIGLPGAEIGRLVSSAASRKENADALRMWLKDRPKES